MASMGFTQESVKKLMGLLDSQKEMDEKTYIELANAAKYLYEKTNQNSSSPLSVPPPTPIPDTDSDSDSGMGPGAVGRSINRRVEWTPSAEDAAALQLAMQWEREQVPANIIVSYYRNGSHRQVAVQQRAPQQTAPQQTAPQQTVAQTAGRRGGSAGRLCGRHKVRGLIKLIREYAIPIPDRSNSNITTYIQTLYDLAKDLGISDVTIKTAYYAEKNEELNAMTPTSRARVLQGGVWVWA